MRFVTSIYRFALAALCLVGMRDAWPLGAAGRWVYLTYQGNLALALVMLWAGAATLLKGVQPPAWLKGCVTFYMALIGLTVRLSAQGILPAGPTLLPGIDVATLLQVVTPIMAFVDFILFDPHRRFAWHYTLTWLAYLPVYIGFVLVRASVSPHGGPGAGGSPYPSALLDLSHLGWGRMTVNLAEGLVCYFALALALFLVDRILPAATPLTAGPTRGRR